MDRMNSKVEQPKPPLQATSPSTRWRLLLVAAGVVAFYWFEPVGRRRARAGRGRAAWCAGAIVFLATGKGVQTREFLSESRFELRKVVWPTRQEAMRTTWVVMIVVVVIEPDPGRLRPDHPVGGQVLLLGQ